MRSARLDAETRRGAILKVATRIVAKKGFGAASFQSIAEACHMKQTAVLYHFPSKDKLLEALLLKIVIHNHEIVSTSIDEKSNAELKLKNHFEANLRWAVDFIEEAQIISLLYYSASFNKRFRAFYGDILQRARYRIQVYLEQGKAENLFRKDLDVKITAEFLHDALLGGITNAVTSNPIPSLVKSNLKKWDLMIDKITK